MLDQLNLAKTEKPALRTQKARFQPGTSKTSQCTAVTESIHTPEYDRQMLKAAEQDQAICQQQGLRGDKLFYVVTLGGWDSAKNVLSVALESRHKAFNLW
eukprot:10877363-Ditylum_brightwellii.AAC.1